MQLFCIPLFSKFLRPHSIMRFIWTAKSTSSVLSSLTSETASYWKTYILYLYTKPSIKRTKFLADFLFVFLQNEFEFPYKWQWWQKPVLHWSNTEWNDSDYDSPSIIDPTQYGHENNDSQGLVRNDSDSTYKDIEDFLDI